jgi:hypothetical protein
MGIGKEHETRPEVGSAEWIRKISLRSSEDYRTFTSIIDEAAKEVLGDTLVPTVWDKMFTDGEATTYSKKRGVSRYTPAFITVSQALGWDKDDPEFRYTAAQLVAYRAESLGPPKDHGDLVVFRLVDGQRVEVPQDPPPDVSIEEMEKRLAEYARSHGIDESTQEDLGKIARVPLIPDTRKQRALGIAQRRGRQGLIGYMTP